jgi:hypothetical protein
MPHYGQRWKNYFIIVQQFTILNLRKLGVIASGEANVESLTFAQDKDDVKENEI